MSDRDNESDAARMSVTELIQGIEDIGFRSKAGPLENLLWWKELRRRFLLTEPEQGKPHRASLRSVW